MNEIDQAPSPYSKSLQKRAAEALKDLGERLTGCNAATLAKCDLPAELLAALTEFNRLPNKHGAKRRQLQFIGKLMRELDEPALARIHAQLNRNVDLEKKRFQQLEVLRDRLLEDDQAALDTVLAQYPGVNVQQLRQLVRLARKEREDNLTPVSARKLFRFLRDLQAGQGAAARSEPDSLKGN